LRSSVLEKRVADCQELLKLTCRTWTETRLRRIRLVTRKWKSKGAEERNDSLGGKKRFRFKMTAATRKKSARAFQSREE